MKPFFETIRELHGSQAKILRRAYGMIEARDGVFEKLQLRPLPKIGSLMEATWIRSSKNHWQRKNICRLYYNQPIFHRNFLTLSYVESSWETTVPTFYAVLDALNQVAYIKRSDAIIAEVTNDRISDRFLRRQGWEPFLEKSSRRHWIAVLRRVSPASCRIASP